jgi:hypothetical protein
VENIIDRSRKWVHGDRIRFYSDDKLDVTEEIKRQFAHDNESYHIKQFHGCRLNSETHQLELLVEWLGFTDEENSWEPLKTLFEDCPELVKSYLMKMKKKENAYANDVEEFIKQSA